MKLRFFFLFINSILISSSLFSGTVSVTGNMYIEQTLTGIYVYSEIEIEEEWTSYYQWYRDDEPISGANYNSYTLTSFDLNKEISLEVTQIAKDGLYPTFTVHSDHFLVLNAAPVASEVSFTGNMNLGQILTGYYQYSDLEGDEKAEGEYQWYSSDDAESIENPISEANGKTYKLTSSDLNKYISFEVTPKSITGTSPGAPVRSQRIAVLNTAPVASEVSVTGNMYKGQILTGQYLYSDLEGDEQVEGSYQWYRSDDASSIENPISGANGSTYELTSFDLNKYISFEVTPRSNNGTTPGEPVRSERIAVLNAKPVASSISINGNRYINQIVEGVYTYSDLENDNEGTSIYKWYIADDVNGPDYLIEEAVQKTYTIKTTDLNKYISFEVIPVAETGSSIGLTLRTNRLAVLNALPSASLVTINGSFKIGQVLQGVYNYTDLENDLEAISGFNWYRANNIDGIGKNQIIGANTKNYVVQSVDMNKYICFEVIPVAASGSLIGNSVSSPFMGPISNSAPYATNVRITGTQAVCKTLRGEYSYEDLEGDLEGATAFRWLKATTLDGVKSPIIGATAREYTLTVQDQGMFIFFEVLPRSSSGTTTGVAIIGNPTGSIVNLLPTVTILGTASICNGSSSKLTISFTGSAPWKLSYSDGTEHHELVSGDPIYLLNVSKSGTYKGDTLVDNINCPVTNLPSSAVISILPLPQVDITGLNNAYNLRNNPVPLVGSPTGGTFSGAGVVSSTNIFYPSLAGTQNSPHPIIYEYKSPQTGCSNRDTVLVEIIDADASITGIRSAAKYCNFDQPFIITGTNIIGTIGSFAISGSTGLTDNLDNTATINPALLTSGNYTVSYSYFDGVQLTIYKEFSIEILDEARIFGVSPSRYCSNISPIEISGNYSGGIFSGNCLYKNTQTNKYYFNPALGISGGTTITYSYLTSYGCSVSKSITATISSVPVVDFKIQNHCFNGDSIIFKNLSVSFDSVVKWDWRFGDLVASEAANRSGLFSPKHKYSAIGNRNVRLMAENIYGCKDTLDKTIHLGDIPIVNFGWKSECFQEGNPVSFTGNISNVDQIIGYNWVIDDTSKINFVYETKDVSHTFPLIRNFQVKYNAISEYGCADSITKVIYLRPVISLKDTFYTNSFEAGKGYWFATDTILSNNWALGIPNGTQIKTAYTGNKAYYTSLKGVRKNLQMIITSPCFDFTKTTRPYISMATFSDVATGQEGAVLQYSKDEGNLWENVGAIGSGIKWFNDFSIQSQPGSQQIGWSGKNSTWEKSQHNLDFLNNVSRVRFRIVFGQNAKAIIDGDGFAFDDIFIGNRSKYVLFEHFTNNSQFESKEANIFLDNLTSQHLNDVIAIQYHTSFPGADNYNNDNPSDPGSRVLYYGIGITPYALLEGGTESRYIYDFSNSKPNTNDINRLSLKEAEFNLGLHVTKTDEAVTGSVDVKAISDILNRNISARVVVVEDIKSQVDGKEVIYQNVVKKILPSAGGTTFSGSWKKGDVETINFSWTFKNVYNSKNLHIVVFLQDEFSHEIYQVAIDDSTDIINGIDGGAKISEEIWNSLIYPNPAHDWVNIDFPETKSDNLKIQVSSINGKTVFSDRILRGVTRYQLNTSSLTNGIYFIRIGSSNKVNTINKLVVLH